MIGLTISGTGYDGAGNWSFGGTHSDASVLLCFHLKK